MTTDTTKQFKQQVPRNAAMAALSFATYTLAALWLTPYLVKHLGSAAYGLVSLAGLFTQYATIITAEISNAVNRFLTIEIQKPDGKPNRTFNSAFALYVALILLQIPIFGLGVVYADRLFSIPAELRIDAMLLLGFSAASFLVSLLSGVFGVSLFATNRLDIGNAMVLSRLIARLILIVLCFSLFGPRLRFIGIVDFALNVLFFPLTIYFWRKLTPGLSLSFREIDLQVLKPLFHMSSWTLINQLGSLLYLRSDIWIINRFISPVAAGQYAAILVVSNFFRQLASQVSGQLNPTIMNFWAMRDLVRLRRLLPFAIKLIAFGLSIPIALLCINAETVLGLWLGEEFSTLALLLVVLAIHLPINTGVLPLYSLNTASNSVRLPALLTLLLGVINVLASYYFGVVAGGGALGVALTTAVVLTLKNTVFIPAYAALILELPVRHLLRPLIGSISMLGLVWLLCQIPLAGWLHLDANGLSGLGTQGIFVCVVCTGAAWILLVSREEKKVLTGMLPARVRSVLGMD